MRSALLMAAVALLTSLSGARADIIAGPIVNPADMHVYYLLSSDTWRNSEAAAVKLGGHLVTVDSAKKQQWLVSTFGPEINFSTHAFWIGLHQDPSGKYLWTSGQPVVYTCWEPGEPSDGGTPNGECIYIGRYADGGWNDTDNVNIGPNVGPQPRGLVEIIPATVAEKESPQAANPGNPATMPADDDATPAKNETGTTAGVIVEFGIVGIFMTTMVFQFLVRGRRNS